MALPATSPARRRGLILARVSRDHSDLGTGVDRQVSIIERMFKREGDIDYDTDDALVDNSVSSYNRERDSWVQGLEALRSREYDVIGLVEFSRLSRSIDEVVNELVPAMIESRAEIMTSDGNMYDASTPMGQARLYRAALDAFTERAQITKRALDWHTPYAEEGRPSGRVPFGYRAITDAEGRNNWEPIPEEADLIRTSVKQLLHGTPMTSILRQWWEAGAKTRTKKEGDWRYGTLRRFLLSPALAGIRRHYFYVRDSRNRYVRERDREGRLLDPKDHDAIWPAIISREDHEALVRLLGSTNEPRRADISSLPSTIIRCGHCGGPMTIGKQKGNGARLYQCKARNGPGSCGRLQVRAEPLEEVVGGQIVAVIQGTSSVFPVIDSDREEELERQVTDLKVRIAELETDHYAGDVSPEGYRGAKAKLEARKADARAELTELRRTDTRGAYIRELKAQGFDMDAWEALSVTDRRHVVSQVIERIDITPAGRHAWSYDYGRYLELVAGRATITWAGAPE
jgi:DNA invertase Pin-like site-specific DNA recombinase